MHKTITYGATLIITIFLAVCLIFANAFLSEGSEKADAASETAEVSETEANVSESIISSANNYLESTSGGDIDSSPVINKAADASSGKVLDLSDEDIYLIASEVTCEAKGEPYDAMVGVANVIINRIVSDNFPDNAHDVIYQEGQFPPAYTGVLDEVLENGPSETCYQATLDALYGDSVAGNYLYFNMTSGVPLSSVREFMTIGDTTFYTP